MMLKFDRTQLDSYYEFMEEDAKSFIQEIVLSFKNGGPVLITEMKQAIQDDHPPAFIRAAHTLKSNCATVGAVDLTEMAAELECEGKITPLLMLTNKVSQAELELTEILFQLEAYLERDLS